MPFNDTTAQVIEQNPNMFQSVINFILSPWGIILIVVIVILYLFYSKKKAPDIFKGVELTKVLKDRFEGQLKIIDERDTRFGTLRRGEVTIGRIKRHGIVSFDTQSPAMPWESKPKKKKDMPKEPQKELETLTKLEIFEIATGQGFFSYIQELLRMNLKIVLIPSDFVKRFSNEFYNNHVDYFNIPSDIDVIAFGEIFFYGFDSYKYIKGQAWLYGREKELEELINYPKRVVFLDSRHAKHTEELEKIYALDEKRRKNYFDSMLPGGKS